MTLIIVLLDYHYLRFYVSSAHLGNRREGTARQGVPNRKGQLHGQSCSNAAHDRARPVHNLRILPERPASPCPKGHGAVHRRIEHGMLDESVPRSDGATKEVK